jgi:acyl-[acyl-carrier-protein] desaturase
MLIDYRREITVEERKHYDACKELLCSIESHVKEALDNHRKIRKDWYPHELLPWGKGIDFRECPWTPNQSPLRPEVKLALETNLLTEDNLPYYHSHIERFVDGSGVWKEWNRLWTAEEAQHGESMRDYLYLLRVTDPKQIADERKAIMEVGFDRHFGDPLELFAYTSAQELATRISHIRTGQRADEPIVLELLKNISRDENFHYVFYRNIIGLCLDRSPDITLKAIANQLYSFEMPGAGMSNFEFRQLTIANAGIYGVKEHRELVIEPVLSYWKIGDRQPETAAGKKAQERILKLDKVLQRMEDKQQRAPKKSDLPIISAAPKDN